MERARALAQAAHLNQLDRAKGKGEDRLRSAGNGEREIGSQVADFGCPSKRARAAQGCSRRASASRTACASQRPG